MFFKVTTSRGHQYLKLVRSYWENGRAKQQVIANLGRLEILKQEGQLSRLAQRLLSLANKHVPTLEDLQELERLYYGDVVYKKLWNSYKFNLLLDQHIRNTKIEYNFLETVYLLVIDRLLHPQSKLACFERQGKYINIEDVQLQHLYRSLDVLAAAKETLEQSIFEQQKNLFNTQIDIVFYDVTTFHFESNRADVLKAFGFSKAGKFNEVQVVLGLLIDQEGHPIGYDLFPGNTFDGKTLLTVLDSLQQRFAIGKIVIVADKGINSQKNFHYIKAAGYDYIVSARLKSSAKKITTQIFSATGWNNVSYDNANQLTFKYKLITDHQVHYRDDHGNSHHHNSHLIITWSRNRAQRDQKERERQLRKAQKIIANEKTLTSKKGCQRYIATEGEDRIVGLDDDRVKADARWDGYYGIQTSETKLDASRVIESYHQLWKIEESFKVLKSTLQTRPIFVWTPDRIKGHFVVCFMALVLERALETKLKANKIEASPEKIKEAILSLEVSKIQLGDQQCYLKSKNLPLASQILNVLRIKHLKNISAKEEIVSQIS